jgi:nucleotide-binding universal stress UspA family protein
MIHQELARLIEELPAERRAVWTAYATSWVERGLRPEDVIAAVGVELAPGAPASAVAIKLAAIVATVATAPVSASPVRPSPVTRGSIVPPVETAPETAATEATNGVKLHERHPLAREPLRQEHQRLLALFPEQFRQARLDRGPLTPWEITWEAKNLNGLNDALRKDLADIGINARKPQGQRTTVAKVDTVRRGPGGDLASGGFAMLSKHVLGTRVLVGVLDVIPGAAFKAYAVSCSVAREDGTFYLGHARLARLLGLKSEASGQRVAELLCRAGLWRKLASGHTGRETDYQLCAIEDIDRTRTVLAAGLRWKAG